MMVRSSLNSPAPISIKLAVGHTVALSPHIRKVEVLISELGAFLCGVGIFSVSVGTYSKFSGFLQRSMINWDL